MLGDADPSYDDTLRFSKKLLYFSIIFEWKINIYL